MSCDSIKYPIWLENHVKDVQQGDSSVTVTLCSSSGNELLEVWYFGELFDIIGIEQSYIVDTVDIPAIVKIRDPQSGEEFTVFDAAKDGYDNMFFYAYSSDELDDRVLTQYEIPASKLILRLGYEVNFDEDKENYSTDENGMVKLINGGVMSWEDVKRNGFDLISLSYIDEEGNAVEILEYEFN